MDTNLEDKIKHLEEEVDLLKKQRKLQQLENEKLELSKEVNQVPQVEVIPNNSPKPASSGKRLVNNIIDSLCVGLIAFCFTITITIFGYRVNPDSGGINSYIIAYILTFLYYVIMESLFGKTIGKLITGTEVVSTNPNGAGFGTVVIRTLCRFIPFEALTFLSNYPVGLHDSLSKTMVVESASLR